MAPIESSDEIWRLLFQMGDKLLSQPSLHAQIGILSKEFKEITGADVEIVLLDSFKPLPSSTPMEGQEDEQNTSQEIEARYYFEKEVDCVENPDKGKQKISHYEIPLVKDDQILGKINLDYKTPQVLDAKFAEFLDIAGGYIAGILDTTRLSLIKDWRLKQLSLVRSASNEIARYRDTRELFRKIVDLIHKTFKLYFVAIYVLDQEKQKLYLQSSAGQQLTKAQLDALNLEDGIPISKGLVGICAASGREILSQDVHSDQSYRLVDGLEEARSEVCLPLKNNDQLLGVLEIISDRVNVFHENDVMVLRILADSVSLAIENSALFEDMLEKTWISTAMLQVAEAAQTHDNIQDLFAALVRILPMLVGVDRCAIYQRGRHNDDFYLNAHHGFDDGVESALAMLPYDQNAARIFQEMMILKMPLDLEWKLLNIPAKGKVEEDKCCKLIPIAAHGHVFGALLVDKVKEGKKDDSGIAHKDILMAIARQIAIAIDNFELKESQQNEAYITAVLLQVAEMVAVSENLDETLSNIIDLLPLVVGIDTALVYIADNQQSRLHLRSSVSQSWKKQVDLLSKSVRFKGNKSLIAVTDQPDPVFCQIENMSPGKWLELDYFPFLENSEIPVTPDPVLMLFPLFIGEERFGMLMVLESDQGVELREKKIEIIKGVAQQLSIAIQNERLKSEMVDRERLKREFQLAQDIQKTFLPEKIPTIQDWKISVRWRPALQVGGDFYDAIPISENRLGLVIADVSNKGLPAALYMTVARTLIHAVGMEGDSPFETLQQVNHLLLENSQEGLFITVFYAILNTDTGEMVYANAGHNKPLLMGKNRNEIIWLEKGGMPLGVTEGLTQEDRIVQIRPGDYLVLYTDGLTEARSPDDALFGEDRLFHVVSSYKSKHSDDLIEVLDSSLLDFQANAPASDDVTLFVIHRA